MNCSKVLVDGLPRVISENGQSPVNTVKKHLTERLGSAQLDNLPSEPWLSSSKVGFLFSKLENPVLSERTILNPPKSYLACDLKRPLIPFRDLSSRAVKLISTSVEADSDSDISTTDDNTP